MVDVSAKAETRRTARAHAFVRIAPAALEKLPENPKGNPLEVARIAGITAAKRTAELIPLCHSAAAFARRCRRHAWRRMACASSATATTTAQTGVEMEALTAASVAALTVYDMLKALDKRIEIQDVYLLEKTGGKSGDFRIDDQCARSSPSATRSARARGPTAPDRRCVNGWNNWAGESR